jgi:hypothetical protein
MLQLSVMGHWEQGHQGNLQFARLWKGTRWKISLDRAASFVVGEAAGCSGGCGFALCCAMSLAGLQQRPRKKGRAEGCFDGADGERSICRTVVRSNAEGSRSEFRREQGYRCERSFPLYCRDNLRRIGCVQVEPYEEQESWGKSPSLALCLDWAVWEYLCSARNPVLLTRDLLRKKMTTRGIELGKGSTKEGIWKAATRRPFLDLASANFDRELLVLYDVVGAG